MGENAPTGPYFGTVGALGRVPASTVCEYSPQVTYQGTVFRQIRTKALRSMGVYADIAIPRSASVTTGKFPPVLSGRGAFSRVIIHFPATSSMNPPIFSDCGRASGAVIGPIVSSIDAFSALFAVLGP